MSWKLAHDRFAIHDRGLKTYIAGDPERTPAGEIEIPCFASSFTSRIWPQAGCAIAISTTAVSVSGRLG